MSPNILTEPFIDSIHSARSWTADGGITSAIGIPRRVTQIGMRVFWTRPSTARHLALNSEIPIFSIPGLNGQ